MTFKLVNFFILIAVTQLVVCKPISETESNSPDELKFSECQLNELNLSDSDKQELAVIASKIGNVTNDKITQYLQFIKKIQSKDVLESENERRIAFVDYLYFSINGTDPTLTKSKFEQIFENDAPRKSVLPPFTQSFTQEEFKQVEIELAKVLSPNQTHEMMEILRGLYSDLATAVVKMTAFAMANSYGLTADDHTKLMEIYSRFIAEKKNTKPIFLLFPCH